MRYLIESTYHDGFRQHIASREHPAVIDVPADLSPGVDWLPMDEAARSALVKRMKEKAQKLDLKAQKTEPKSEAAALQNKKVAWLERAEAVSVMSLAKEPEPKVEVEVSWKTKTVNAAKRGLMATTLEPAPLPPPPNPDAPKVEAAEDPSESYGGKVKIKRER